MSTVFISHAEEDESIAVALADGLERAGFACWYYERDSIIGNSYIEEIGNAINACMVVVVLISSHSIDSHEVTREVESAYQERKHFLPLLVDLSHQEFTQRQPTWRHAFGASVSVRIPADGVQAILPRLCEALQQWDVPAEHATPASPAAPVHPAVAEPAAPPTPPASERCVPAPVAAQQSLRIALLYKRDAQPDGYVLKLLEEQLGAQGHRVFIDRHLTVGVEWAREIEGQVRGADAVIPLLSAASVQSEMLAHEVQIAHDAALLQRGKPRILPVRVQFTAPLPYPLAENLNPIEYATWDGPQDDAPLLAALTNGLQAAPAPKRLDLGPVGGAMPLDSSLYIERPLDAVFYDAITRRDTIVLLKGARQMGKTSLLARGLHRARQMKSRVIFTDFQKFNAEQLQSADTLFRALAEWFADELDLQTHPDDVWQARRGANINFERYLKRVVLGEVDTPLVWGLDEVDRLFGYPFAGEVFGLFRSWHNARSLDPTWSRLTMAIAYATEAHLFITDLNQSPFNVGTRLMLHDFTREQIADLNQRYGSPLRDEAEVARYDRLVSGQPYLTQRGFREMVSHDLTLRALEASADRDDGPFGDHLRRLLVVLAKDQEILDATRDLLRGKLTLTPEQFYRLQSSGILAGDSSREARLRCQLYQTYLERHLLQ